MAFDLPVERDFTLIFERDNVREAMAGHCARGHEADALDQCEHCKALVIVLALAIDEWLGMVDQDRASRR